MILVAEAEFRWVRHAVEGLRLFVDIRFGEGETCSGDEEVFVKEVDLPTPVLHMIAGRAVPEIPAEIREVQDNDVEQGGRA